MAKINKAKVEVFKTVLIAVMISSIAGFLLGVKFANKQHAQVDAAVQTAESQHVAEIPAAVPSKK